MMKLTKIFLVGALFGAIIFTGCGENSGTNTDNSTQDPAKKNGDLQLFYTIDRANGTFTAHLKGTCELVDGVPVWNSDFTMDMTTLGYTFNNDTLITFELIDPEDYFIYYARVSGSPGSMDGRWKKIGRKDTLISPDLVLDDSIKTFFKYMDISGDTIKPSSEINPNGDFVLTIGMASILEDIFRLQDNPEAVLSEEVWVDGFYITSRDMDLIHVFFKDFDILDQSNKSITFARKGMQFSALVKETVWISYSQSFGLQVSGNGKTCDFNSIEGSVESTEMCKAENASILSFSNNTLGMYSQNNSTEFLNCLRSMF